MKRFFNMDGPLITFLNGLADVIILNLLFVLCSIPVVTIGPSLCALSYATVKLIEGGEGYTFRNFFKAFKQNLLQGTIIGVIMLLFAAAVVLDYSILAAQTGSVRTVMFVTLVVGVIAWLMVFVYIFPLQARFYNPVRITFTNALILAIANLPVTLLLIGAIAGAAALTFWNTTTFGYALLFWLMAGFAAFARLQNTLLLRIFNKIAPPPEKPADYDPWEDGR